MYSHIIAANPSPCSEILRGIFITPHTCARGKAISFVSRLLSVCYCCPLNCQIWTSEKIISIMNKLKSAKNWLKYVSNRLAQPMSVTNSVFLLARPLTVPTTAGHVFCAHAHKLPGRGRQTYAYIGPAIFATMYAAQIPSVYGVCALWSSSWHDMAKECGVTSQGWQDFEEICTR